MGRQHTRHTLLPSTIQDKSVTGKLVHRGIPRKKKTTGQNRPEGNMRKLGTCWFDDTTSARCVSINTIVEEMYGSSSSLLAWKWIKQGFRKSDLTKTPVNVANEKNFLHRRPERLGEGSVLASLFSFSTTIILRWPQACHLTFGSSLTYTWNQNFFRVGTFHSTIHSRVWQKLCCFIVPHPQSLVNTQLVPGWHISLYKISEGVT